jgi:predicted Zn-dependent peptidase
MRYGFSHLYGSELTAEEERIRVSQITTLDILRVAREIFVAEKLNFILVGPYTPDLKSSLNLLVQSF